MFCLWFTSHENTCWHWQLTQHKTIGHWPKSLEYFESFKNQINICPLFRSITILIIVKKFTMHYGIGAGAKKCFLFVDIFLILIFLYKNRFLSMMTRQASWQQLLLHNTPPNLRLCAQINALEKHFLFYIRRSLIIKFSFETHHLFPNIFEGWPIL